jgi:hypothetical protein
MTRFMIATTAAVLLGCGCAAAQVGGMSVSPGPSPLGMTSSLGMGPGTPSAPAGIPLGATQLASPGVSPMTSGASPMGPTTGSVTMCSGIGGSMPQTSFGMGGSSMTGTSSGAATSTAGMSGSTSVFDGGGMAGTASGTCAAIGSSSLAGPAASASSGGGMGSGSSVGRVGIPLGSTELGSGGLSPPSVALTTNPLAPLMTLTPLVVIPNQSAPSSLGSTTPCQTTGTGVPGPGGVTTPFGAPLTGRALSLAETQCGSAQ